MTHGAGIVLTLLMAGCVMVKAGKLSKLAMYGAMIFGVCTLIMFTTSTLYHAITDPDRKYRARQADHMGIFFMIAGSYTPFIILFYNNPAGQRLLLFMWMMTFLGSAFKLFFTGKFELLSTIIYVLMGLSILSVGPSFSAQLPIEVAHWLLVGGACYLIGVVFYRWKSWRYHHPIWHLCVMGGAMSHWYALWWGCRLAI